MNANLIAEASIVLAAQSDKVWKALTDPDLIRKYLFGTNTESDWKVGSPVTFSGTWEGKAYQDKGRILAVERGKLLKYTYWSSMAGTPDVPENYANVTYRLTPQGDYTELTVLQDNCKSIESRDHSAKNWHVVLESLAKVITAA